MNKKALRGPALFLLKNKKARRTGVKIGKGAWLFVRTHPLWAGLMALSGLATWFTVNRVGQRAKVRA